MKPNGYIALTSMLIILAATLVVAMSANLLSIDTGRTSVTLEDGMSSFALANTCLEEGLLRLRQDMNYTGGSLNAIDGSCTITVLANGTQRELTSEATVDSSTRHITVDVDLASGFSFDSWRE
ncbi:MAG TPA: hypothetical protein DIS62_05230 [Candidatus Kerfeldbacteria bacterium]|nr:MAG: hypothetical protein UY34_C0005G0047 [Parcubacteria group bacterium GW2011_GWA2_48_9]KKW15919.1 MAG: hypothetical protein UY52_C0012G0006 [Parcubacteria group bacterium GW2011_GWC2_49_9]HCJ52510.1 hypothetical protein [Candidatus Kerfeldbacteria bacterium]HCM68366.1 hypothetical protein [Candidatus Kerfeldbacteria bacterium]